MKVFWDKDIIMASVDVINCNGEKVTEMELNDDIFNVDIKESVLHDVVVMQLAKRRSGNAKVKNRSDVKGSTKKLFRQKGTGRARRGNITSPLLRGGGVVFGPQPKSYEYRIPRKVRKSALKMALSSKLKTGNLTVIDNFDLDRINTKTFKEILDKINKKETLIISNQKDETLELSSRNIPDVKVLRTEGVNVYDVLKYKDLVLLSESIERIEGRLV